MVEIADIFRIHGQEYREKFENRMPKSHIKVMQAIEECRTETMGGQLYFCEKCEEYHYSYHSCKNRHCPKCQNNNANDWLEKQNDLLLPVTHFMVTFTLPEPLRKIARSNQKIIYNILFKASAEAMQKLARDPKYIGGKLGMVGVLHTWSRNLNYHPHVHYIVTGGGVSDDTNTWMPANEKFLMPVKALSVIFRAKFRDELKKTELFNDVPQDTWKKDWVVHSEPVGSGKHAFKYLAPYIFRVAISNNRIIKLENGKVTFKYKQSDNGQTKIQTISAEEFIRRFLQHVLPKRFVKVRYYGIWAARNRNLLYKAKELLHDETSEKNEDDEYNDEDKSKENKIPRCPNCGNIMVMIREIKPQKRKPP